MTPTFSATSSSAASTANPYQDGYYRIGQVHAIDGYCLIYNLDGSIYKRLAKSIESDSSTWYCDKLEVAAYYQAFGELPVNYVYNEGDSSRTLAIENYGKLGRLYSKYYSRTNGYCSYMPPLNRYYYFEIDIADVGNNSYNNGSRISRGAERLVVFPYGLKAYGDESVLFYTNDHYESFAEFLNYGKRGASFTKEEGFGEVFAGSEDSAAPAYQTPETISLYF